MGDIVVTVPQKFTHPSCPGCVGLEAWIKEGDAAGDPWSGQYWVFSTWGVEPQIVPGEAVYVVCQGKVRGYSPLVEMVFESRRGSLGRVDLIRGDGAVAVTIPKKVQGFRGWRYRWWDKDEEVPFPGWRTP